MLISKVCNTFVYYAPKSMSLQGNVSKSVYPEGFIIILSDLEVIYAILAYSAYNYF